MFLYRNNLIFGLIWRMIKFIFSAIYKILSLFNLQITTLLLLIGVILYFTGALTANPVFLLIYELVIILSIVYAIIGTIKNLLGIGKKKDKIKRSKGAEIISSDDEEKEEPKQEEKRETENIQTDASEEIQEEKPRYYRVKQNSNYIMAEYSDRYELFLIKDGGLIKVRTDKKFF